VSPFSLAWPMIPSSHHPELTPLPLAVIGNHKELVAMKSHAITQRILGGL
jgi:hypothetical protein